MNKPTAHPWRVIIDDTGDEYTGWPSISAPEDVDASIVHRAGFKQEFWGDLSQRECIANAHLMASSPELRNALESVMRLAQRFASQLDVTIPAEVMNEYNFALAKSKGNAPPPELEDEDEQQLVAPRSFLSPVTPSQELGAIVGYDPLPRTEITKKIWEYIKQHNLQDASNRRMINADAKLKRIFQNKKQVSMFEMTKMISDHLK